MEKLMQHRRFLCGAVFLALACAQGFTQQPHLPLTWEQVRDRFETNNPTMQAERITVDEARAQEITAFLRPNPTLTLNADQIDPFPGGQPHGTFAYFLPIATVDYLHERQHKRELRLESAKKATAVEISNQADLERTLIFALRGAFVQTLQAKAVRSVARENLDYYDKVLQVSGERFKAGDIAQVDLDRLQLQRVQYESDYQSAEVNLRTAKIQLLALLNDRTPVEQFDVVGPFDFADQLQTLQQVRQAALDTRPDLKAAVQAVDKARTDHQLAVANGSTDPTFGFDVGRNPPIDGYFGFSLNVPLRIFDRNQGEKQRTQLDIARNERLRDAAQAQVFSDVDSAYAALNSTLTLLRPYKTQYLQQATRVRDTVSFAYQHGGASLLDFLNAQSEYRTVELSYTNLVGSYLIAAGQLNQAVGREVIP
jgi:cobalt-zinc-cadmium efflux system outer membrane protein